MAEWYYTRNNQQMGPVSWDELRQMAGTGLLAPTDMVWKEGLVDWMKASKKDGLFQERSPRGEGRGDDEAFTERSKRRSRDDDVDDYDDRPRRRRRPSAGMPLGAKVAIIGGSIAVGLLLLVIIIILVVRGGTGPVQEGPGAYQMTLFQGRDNIRYFRFNAGQNVRITVTTQAAMNPDVDLFVERNNRFPVASDTRVSKDCFVNFVAPATDTYRIRVVNLGPGTANCNVNVQ